AKSRDCVDIKSCLETVSQITGQKYLLREGVENKKVDFTSNQEITTENADLIITNVLMLNELARIPTGEPNSYYIQESKAALQAPIAIYEGSLDAPAKLPRTFDIVTLKYKLKDEFNAADLQRYLTDYLPRNGRVSAIPNTGYLFITDTAMNVARIVEILKAVDQSYSPAYKKQVEAKRRESQAKARSSAAKAGA
ncbi:MAG: secretin N-terminal domain-containing protein, partial [Bdellovibrionota bacterium]